MGTSGTATEDIRKQTPLQNTLQTYAENAATKTKFERKWKKSWSHRLFRMATGPDAWSLRIPHNANYVWGSAKKFWKDSKKNQARSSTTNPTFLPSVLLKVDSTGFPVNLLLVRHWWRNLHRKKSSPQLENQSAPDVKGNPRQVPRPYLLPPPVDAAPSGGWRHHHPWMKRRHLPRWHWLFYSTPTYLDSHIGVLQWAQPN